MKKVWKVRTLINTYSVGFRRVKIQKHLRKFVKCAFITILFLLLFPATSFSQNPPDEIRGYKVYNAKISVSNNSDKTDADKSDAVIKLGDPQATDVSLSGVDFEITGEISNLQQSGTIDFLIFENFRVNNLPVEIEEYHQPFEISKNKIINLPKPIKINLGFGQALRGAWQEQHDSKPMWQVTGRVLVFGHFKKSFFKFKRVVPIDVNMQIKNPLKELGN